MDTIDKFTAEEQVVILELARVALADSDTFSQFGELLDLPDDYLTELRDKIEAVTNGVDIDI